LVRENEDKEKDPRHFDIKENLGSLHATVFSLILKVAEEIILGFVATIHKKKKEREEKYLLGREVLFAKSKGIGRKRRSG